MTGKGNEALPIEGLKETPVFVDRYIPLVPAVSAMLCVATLVIAVADRRICKMQDRAATREHAAIQLGYQAGLKQLANR